jgi:hypothetical protein
MLYARRGGGKLMNDSSVANHRYGQGDGLNKNQPKGITITANSSSNTKKNFITAWNGWLLTLLLIFAFGIVVSPILKEGMYQHKRHESHIRSDKEAAVVEQPQQEQRQQKQQQLPNDVPPVVPECELSPWKADEDLVGTCPGIRAKNASLQTVADCALACCSDPDCIVWQFRADKGCLQGGDVRIGQEKDGPAAYCSDHPPLRWQGQFVKDRKGAECSTDTWHPDEQLGQCFGLGDPRKGISTAGECMQACCSHETCGAWQFQETLGCFYNTRMFSCQRSDDPILFEPHVGRRKRRSSRTYTGPRGEPAVNWNRKDN